MLLKFTLITVLTYTAFATNELESLHGINAGNRVTLCMNPGNEKDECEGVMWQRNWVLVKGSCVADKALYPVIVLPARSAACESIVTDKDVSGFRRVRARFMHPLYPATDIALLNLDRPYDVPEPPRNDSSAIIYKLDPWLTDTCNQYSLPTPKTRLNAYNSKRIEIFSSPIRMFMTTVVLPLTSFIVFFMFITFFTGSSKNSVPYKSLHNKEESNFA